MIARRRPFLLVVAGLLVLIAIAAVPTVIKQRWRLQLLAMKARGQISDTSWSEIAHLMRPGSGFVLDDLRGRANPYESIRNPFNTSADIEAGRQIFRQTCVACHGADARGTGNGPALADRILRRSNNDWATYKVIINGIDGTSMPPHRLPWDDSWRLVAFVRSIAAGAEASSSVSVNVNVPPSRIVEAADHPDDWLTYSGTYDGQRFSRLTQISASNVADLQVQWIHHIDTRFDRNLAVPLISNGVMFLTAPLAKVFALDAATGKPYWTFEHPVADQAISCCGKVNRGVALLNDRVYVGTLDAHLIALEAANGKKVWDTVVADYRQEYAITAAPLAVNDKVITGIAGGDFATRGFLAAYNAKDGTQAWRLNTIPGPGEPGNGTWSGDSWRTGGAAPWMTGSFDPRRNVLYWGVGNPAPDFNGESRQGDNLYSESVVALDADTGKMHWHFQFTPHDLYDFDSAQVPVLIDNVGGASPQRVIAWPNRNAFFYLLDAESGKFLLGKPFAKQTWAEGLDEAGRPIPRPGQQPSVKGTLISPSAEGATNWWPPAYSSKTGLLYVPVLERPAIYFSSVVPPSPSADKRFMGYFLGGGLQGVSGEKYYTAVRALNPLTGDLVWERRWPDRIAEIPEIPGLLATMGDLVLGADLTTAFALDARTGAVLWSFDTGAIIATPPVTYAVNGKQYVSFVSGKLLLTFALRTRALDAASK
jgi:alcohol dehydrogenase (cytochrome c)